MFLLKIKKRPLPKFAKQLQPRMRYILAPDPDREGEIIAWHIEQEIEKVVKDPSKIHRITFNEITKACNSRSIAHQRDVDHEKGCGAASAPCA